MGEKQGVVGEHPLLGKNARFIMGILTRLSYNTPCGGHKCGVTHKAPDFI